MCKALSQMPAYKLSHLNPFDNLARWESPPYFTNEETEAQGASVIAQGPTISRGTAGDQT